VEVCVRIERLTSILPSQSNDGVVEHIEREAPSKVSFEVRLEEVVPSFEEIPGMVKLDSPKLWEVVFPIDTFGVERIVHDSSHQDGGRANGTGHEFVTLASGGTQDGVVEIGHEAGQEGITVG